MNRLDVIRLHVSEVIARPSADGRFYCVEAQAIDDRARMLRVVDAAKRLLDEHAGERATHLGAIHPDDSCANDLRDALRPLLKEV
jgi:hypothetical protein